MDQNRDSTEQELELY